jgi:hypothetical protein
VGTSSRPERLISTGVHRLIHGPVRFALRVEACTPAKWENALCCP